MEMHELKKEDDFTFANMVNVQCTGLKRAELNPDSFKCLIFVQGLVSTKDAEIRILNKLENEPNLTLQNLAEDCQRC